MKQELVLLIKGTVYGGGVLLLGWLMYVLLIK